MGEKGTEQVTVTSSWPESLVSIMCTCYHDNNESHLKATTEKTLMAPDGPSNSVLIPTGSQRSLVLAGRSEFPHQVQEDPPYTPPSSSLATQAPLPT